MSPQTRFSHLWGGAAGDGLKSVGRMLTRLFNNLGYTIHDVPATQSVIRGGHLWHQFEVARDPLHSFDAPLDLIVALTPDTLEHHGSKVKDSGALLLNSDRVRSKHLPAQVLERGLDILELPMTSLAREVDVRRPVLGNVAAIGCIQQLLGISLDHLEELVKWRFKEKGDDLVEMNMAAAAKGWEHAEKEFSWNFRLVEPDHIGPKRALMSGNDCIAAGSAAAGLKFLAQYPITPASSILHYLSRHASEFGIVVRQVEDEIAAINMAVAGSFAGARSMTATSGPGFSLMAEAYSYAGMTETPVVIVNCMRGGPSTGIPTRPEQSDLNCILGGGHGDFPRALIAPRNISECFESAVRAFNIADRFQMPVVLASDFHLSEHVENIPVPDLDVEIDRGWIWDAQSDGEFERYRVTKDGVSPRAFPGTPGAIHVLVGAEHDSHGHSLAGSTCGFPASSIARQIQIPKRYAKLETLRSELDPPELWGPDHADWTIVSWGSLQGAVRGAVEILNSRAGPNFNSFEFRDIHPMPIEKVKDLFSNIDGTLLVELNYTGQFEQHLAAETGIKIDHPVRIIDGETPTPTNVISHIDEVLA